MVAGKTQQLDGLMNEREELEARSSLRERVRHFQKIWPHGFSCRPRSYNNDWSDCEFINWRSEVCCQRS